jgi:hypothetical protein
VRRILVVSTPAILEARNLAAWITRERIPGIRIAPSKGEWGVFAPARYAGRARRAFRKVVAAANPGGFRVVFKIRPQDPYTVMKKRQKFGRSMQVADMLVKGIVTKAAVLDSRGKVRFVAFKRGSRAASNPGMESLADAAVMMAARAARQYLDVHKLSADPGALTSCLKSWVKIKFPEALKDAKDAIAAGMHAVAEQTFAATMRLAGIEAAKEAARAPSAGKNQPNKPRFYQDSMGKIHDWNTGAIASLPVSPVVVMSYRTKPPSLFKTWRAGGERHWDYLGPRKGENPRRARRKARRNARSYSRRGRAGRVRRNGTMSTDEAWAMIQWLAAHQRARWQVYRQYAVRRLQTLHAGSGQGISSSDVNHTLVGMIVAGDVPIPKGAPWRKAMKNASIESRWPKMTETQREYALRIVGIERDTAELWSYKEWEDLSSVVRVLLKRSWRHGGDTTKIRRVPVGVR